MLKEIYSVLSVNMLNRSQLPGEFIPISVQGTGIQSECVKFIILVDLVLDVNITLHGQGW